MLSRIRSWISAPVTRGNGVLFLACLLSLAVGLTEVGEPVENMLRHGRDQLRPLKASGDIVVVGIDSPSLKAINKWPWPRAYHAKMIDKLNEAGAQKIVFDFDFSNYSDPKNDRLMADAIKRANYKVYLANRFFIDQSTGLRSDQSPIPEFARHARQVNINWWIDYFGVPRGFPYATKVNGQTMLSMASILTDRTRLDESFFRADYAIDVDSVKNIRAVDLLNGNFPPGYFNNKKVVIASSTPEIDRKSVV